MPILILLLFIAVPIAEIALFIELGGWIGLWPTIGCIVLTAMIGTVLLRQQGLSVLTRVRESHDRGEVPLDAVFDGACLLVAGLLLLTPGFLTDSVGFALFVPPFRRWLGRGLWQLVRHRGTIHVDVGGSDPRPRREGPGAGGRSGPDDRPTAPVIDADFEDIPPSADSPWSRGDGSQQ